MSALISASAQDTVLILGINTLTKMVQLPAVVTGVQQEAG